jgi:hypothetical protein
MTNVNTCDLQCPVKAMLGIEVRCLSPLAYAWLSLEGIKQVGYAAAVCASRSESPATWEPSERCTAKATEAANQLQPFEGELTAWEATTLGRIGLGADLLPVDPHTPPAEA